MATGPQESVMFEHRQDVCLGEDGEHATADLEARVCQRITSQLEAQLHRAISAVTAHLEACIERRVQDSHDGVAARIEDVAGAYVDSACAALAAAARGSSERRTDGDAGSPSLSAEVRAAHSLAEEARGEVVCVSERLADLEALVTRVATASARDASGARAEAASELRSLSSSLRVGLDEVESELLVLRRASAEDREAAAERHQELRAWVRAELDRSAAQRTTAPDSARGSALAARLAANAASPQAFFYTGSARTSQAASPLAVRSSERLRGSAASVRRDPFEDRSASPDRPRKPKGATGATDVESDGDSSSFGLAVECGEALAEPAMHFIGSPLQPAELRGSCARVSLVEAEVSHDPPVELQSVRSSVAIPAVPAERSAPSLEEAPDDKRPSAVASLAERLAEAAREPLGARSVPTRELIRAAARELVGKNKAADKSPLASPLIGPGTSQLEQAKAEGGTGGAHGGSER